MSDIMKKLEQSKKLLELGILTPEEFETRKASYLEQLGMGESDQQLPASHPLAQSSRTMIGNSIPQPANSVARTTLSGSTNIASAEAFSQPSSLHVSSQHLKQIGQYKILRLLGQGGMGVVFKARHKNEHIANIRGDVAIKLIKEEYVQDPQLRERFVQEAGLGMRLSHSNVASVIDFYEEGSKLAFIMDYIEGVDLKAKISKNGMSVSQMLALVTPLASAIDYLHSQNIIHRDIKPSNVKIKPDGTPVILDFGIAKSIDNKTHRTRTGMAMGTVAYMAPEQMNAKNITKSVDQYSLGMMVYELLSGRLPWSEEATDFHIYGKKVADDLASLHSVKPEISTQISNAVGCALALNPADRYPSCEVFLQSILTAHSNSTDSSTHLQQKNETLTRQLVLSKRQTAKLTQDIIQLKKDREIWKQRAHLAEDKLQNPPKNSLFAQLEKALEDVAQMRAKLQKKERELSHILDMQSDTLASLASTFNAKEEVEEQVKSLTLQLQKCKKELKAEKARKSSHNPDNNVSRWYDIPTYNPKK